MVEVQFRFIDVNFENETFIRTDAVSATLSETEGLFRGTFPLAEERFIERGLLIALPKYGLFEIRAVDTSSIDGTQSIEAENLGIAEISDRIIPWLLLKNIAFDSAVRTVVGQTAWHGTVVVDGQAPGATLTYATWEIYVASGSRLHLRAGPSASSKSLGRYKSGVRVTELSQHSSSWVQVRAGGLTGFMHRDYLRNRRTVTAPGMPLVNIDQHYGNAYDHLMEIANQTGVRMAFTSGYSAGAIQRSLRLSFPNDADPSKARLTVDRNILKDQIAYDDRELFTCVFATGKDNLTFAGVTWTEASGKPVDKPSAWTEVEDFNATAMFGRNGRRREAYIEFPDIDNKAQLLDSAWVWLQQHNVPRLSMQLSAISLRDIGYGGADLSVGDKVDVIIPDARIAMMAAVTEKTTDFLHPENTVYTIGNYDSGIPSETARLSVEMGTLTSEVWKLRNIVT